jgi:hypothetical protein
MRPLVPVGMGIEYLMWVLGQPGPDGKTEWQRLRLDLPLQPKERPRQGQGRSFTSPRYRQWQQAAQEALRGQWGDRETLQYALFGIEFHGHARSDVDNLEGAVLDAAVKAGVFRDDRCSRLPAHLSYWQPAAQPVAILYVRPWWPPRK